MQGHDESKWLYPMGVDKLTLAFPVNVKQYMPEYLEIPSEYRNLNNLNRSNLGVSKWLRFQSDWFSKGLGSISVAPKNGINAEMAIKHLAIIQQSYEPKHEHKMAAVAYLASLWFEDVVYTVKGD